MAELASIINTQTYDKLIGGSEIPILNKVVTVASGAGSLARGTVLGKITASGKYTKVNSAASDGSQVPDVILAEDVDATGADKDAIVYRTGLFNRGALVFGGTDTADTHEEALRDKGIFLTAQI